MTLRRPVYDRVALLSTPDIAPPTMRKSTHSSQEAHAEPQVTKRLSKARLLQIAIETAKGDATTNQTDRELNVYTIATR
jgi:hypothetical protein